MSNVFAGVLARWRLAADGAAIETPTSHLLPVRRDGAPLMLKLLKPSSDEAPGIRALHWFGGDGAVRLIEETDDAVLMERASGPRSLRAMALAGDDAGALRIIAEVAAQLHVPKEAEPPQLPTLRERFRALFAGGNAHPVLARCAETARELLAAPRQSVVLHGDLHHDNILDSARGWLAIDPKGVSGEAAYDVANLFLNPSGAENLVLDGARAARRATLLSDALGLERDRVLGFAFAHAGLSAAWCIEDGMDPRVAIEAALMLERLTAAEA